MKKLHTRFQPNLDGRCNPACVVQGDKYRFTVLTTRMLRMEYAEDGVFEDRPTQIVWNRNFDHPAFTVRDMLSNAFTPGNSLLVPSILRRTSAFSVVVEAVVSCIFFLFASCYWDCPLGHTARGCAMLLLPAVTRPAVHTKRNSRTEVRLHHR